MSNELKKLTKVGVIGFAFRLGIRSLLSGDVKIALKRIILPVNYAERDNFEEKYEGQPLFKERQYDLESLKARIESNIKGKMVEKILIYERQPFDAVWNRLPSYITLLFAFVESWVDVFNLSIDTNGTRFHKVESVVMILEIEK